MKLFIKTWKSDYPWLKLAIKSMVKLCQEPVHWTIVGDQGSRAEIRQLCHQVMQETCLVVYFSIFEIQEHWPEVNGVNGYYAQQWVKMNAHLVMGDDYFFNWDSDVIAVKEFTSDIFFGKSGKPTFWFSQFNHLIQHGNADIHRQRMGVMRDIVGIPEISFEYMRCMPVPMNGAILRCGSTRQEWSNSLNAILNNRAGFSEFNIIGLFSHLYFPDCYEWRNADSNGPTYAGGWDQNGNCFQAHAYVSQRYSWGGIEAHIEKWVNDLFIIKSL